jgi:hypothetical protein
MVRAAGDIWEVTMMDRVGTKQPTEQEIAAFTKQIAEVREKVIQSGLILTTEERAMLPRFRTGGEAIVDLIATLATKKNLALPGISGEGMKADLGLAKKLVPLQRELEGLLQVVSDTILQANGESWWSATAYYAALCGQTRSDPALADALKPAVDFFSTGKRKAKADK